MALMGAPSPRALGDLVRRVVAQPLQVQRGLLTPPADMFSLDEERVKALFVFCSPLFLFLFLLPL